MKEKHQYKEKVKEYKRKNVKDNKTLKTEEENADRKLKKKTYEIKIK